MALNLNKIKKAAVSLKNQCEKRHLEFRVVLMKCNSIKLLIVTSSVLILLLHCLVLRLPVLLSYLSMVELRKASTPRSGVAYWYPVSALLSYLFSSRELLIPVCLYIWHSPKTGNNKSFLAKVILLSHSPLQLGRDSCLKCKVCTNAESTFFQLLSLNWAIRNLNKKHSRLENSF